MSICMTIGAKVSNDNTYRLNDTFMKLVEERDVKKQRIYAGVLVGTLATVMTACGGQKEKMVSVTEVEEKYEENEAEVTEAPAASEESVAFEETIEEKQGQLEEGETQEAETKEKTEGQDLLNTLSNWSFSFSSGVGAWATSLDINSDGSFHGIYSDSDMGTTGKGYPGGTIYYCEFTGQFTEPVKINDYTYTMKIEEMDCKQEENKTEIKNKCRYVYSAPYGLDGADEIYIYTPDALVNKLPEGYMNWVYQTEESPKNLDCYGLYNVAEETGFTSTKNSERYQSIRNELREVEEKAAEIEERMETEPLTQLEYNELSEELYQLWDDELNVVWSKLKEQIEKETMEYITEEEREWIKEKEKTVKKAGAEYAGGSMQLMVENLKAAELTKDRTYQLIQLLKYQ